MKSTSLLTLTSLYLSILAIATMALLPHAYAQEQSRTQTLFLQGIADIPLMIGLEELYDQTIQFDKPSGRITEVSTLVIDPKLTHAEILRYYQDTLPQLGWTMPQTQQDTQPDQYRGI